MSWAIGYDGHWKRDIGYGVPAVCDHPGCNEKIDRGLGHVCGGEPYGGERGCGLYFCGEHLLSCADQYIQLCERCLNSWEAFEPKPDIAEWVQFKLTDDSWAEWREANKEEVAKLRLTL